MNKKVLGAFVVMLIVAMLATPVLAFGPIKSNIDKNKNLVYYEEDGDQTLVRMINQAGIISEWINREPGQELRLSIRDASKVNIGNVVDGLFNTVQNLPFIPLGNILVFRAYENNWLYLTGDQYSNMLQGFGFAESDADAVAANFDDGVYLKANFIHK